MADKLIENHLSDLRKTYAQESFMAYTPGPNISPFNRIFTKQ